LFGYRTHSSGDNIGYIVGQAVEEQNWSAFGVIINAIMVNHAVGHCPEVHVCGAMGREVDAQQLIQDIRQLRRKKSREIADRAENALHLHLNESIPIEDQLLGCRHHCRCQTGKTQDFKYGSLIVKVDDIVE